ncbi:MAG: protein-tyrosine-phosphatase, partial [Ignavibacteriae bacterium HGW-Ignavibacteriae-3]
KLICDLRTPDERSGRNDRIHGYNGTAIVNIPLYPHNENFNRKEFIHFLSNLPDGKDFESLVRNYYRRFAFEQSDQLRKIFELISDESNLPALIHCSVGKDRTGFVSAVIQLLARIPREDVMDDYMMSNKFTGVRTKRMIRYLRLMSLFRISAEKLKPMLEVRPEYLNDVLDEIIITYGSVEKYLTGKAGVSQSSINNFLKIIKIN